MSAATSQSACAYQLTLLNWALEDFFFFNSFQHKTVHTKSRQQDTIDAVFHLFFLAFHRSFLHHAIVQILTISLLLSNSLSLSHSLFLFSSMKHTRARCTEINDLGSLSRIATQFTASTQTLSQLINDFPERLFKYRAYSCIRSHCYDQPTSFDISHII